MTRLYPLCTSCEGRGEQMDRWERLVRAELFAAETRRGQWLLAGAAAGALLMVIVLLGGAALLLLAHAL